MYSELSILLVLVLHLSANLPECSAHPLSQMAPRLIVISFDGFRADYLNETLTPFMYSMANNGVTGRMRSQYVTKTYPNHMSIMTGLYEDEHGLIGNSMFDPELNATFDLANRESRWWDNGRSFPIWIANELANDNHVRHSASNMWPGGNVAFRGKVPTYQLDYDSEMSWKKRVDLLTQWLLNDEKPANFGLLYFDEPDSLSHRYGPFSTAVKDVIKQCDDIVAYLVQCLRKSKLMDSTNIIILSDHGMAEINRSRVIELDTFLDRHLYEMHGTSPVFNLRINPQNLENVYEILKKESAARNFTVYRRSEVPVEYHYRDNRRILDVVIEAHEGFDIVQKMSDDYKINSSWGNHGYNNSLESMRPLFLGLGSAFKQSYLHPIEFDNIDLYPLICMILQLNASSTANDKFHQMLSRNDGRLSNVVQLLKPIHQTTYKNVSSEKAIKCKDTMNNNII